LSLDQRQRERLVVTLLDSLPPKPMTEDEIFAEAVQRDQELMSGAVQPMTEAEFRAGLIYRRGE
jgi:hypothetical protein